MIKWIKFYNPNSVIVNTFNVTEGKFESEGQEHEFTSFEDAVSKSTEEVLVIWGEVEISQGSVSE